MNECRHVVRIGQLADDATRYARPVTPDPAKVASAAANAAAASATPLCGACKTQANHSSFYDAL